MTLEERVGRAFRNRVLTPRHHRLLPSTLSAVSALGAGFAVWGLVRLKIWPTVLGTAPVFLGKLWFLDRMVWLYEGMAKSSGE